MSKIKIVSSMQELVQELGISKGDTINVVASPIDREYDLEIQWRPETPDEFETVMKHVPWPELKKMGVGIWEKHDPEDPDNKLKEGEVHYLFAGEWYDHIPDGLEIVGIFGKVETFKKGESDDDTRFGCLPYGWIRKEEPNE